VCVCLQVVKFWSVLPLLLLLLLFGAVSDVLLLLACVERKINLHSRFSFRLLLLQCLVFERVCEFVCVSIFACVLCIFYQNCIHSKVITHFHSNFCTLKRRYSSLTAHSLIQIPLSHSDCTNIARFISALLSVAFNARLVGIVFF